VASYSRHKTIVLICIDGQNIVMVSSLSWH